MSDLVLPDNNSIESIRTAMTANSLRNKAGARTFQIDDLRHTARIFGDVAIITGSLTANATIFVNGKDRLMTVIFKPVSLRGGPYIITFSSGIANTTEVKVPVSSVNDTILSGSLLFDVYIDSVGNVSSNTWEVSGFNSNGSWIMFADGTMHEQGQGHDNALSYVANGGYYYHGFSDPLINFPVSFIDTAYSFKLSGIIANNGLKSFVGAGRYSFVSTVSGAYAEIWKTDSSLTADTYWEWSADGRWRA